MVFPKTNRNNFKFSKNSEPIFTYLNQSARIKANKVRDLIENWFSHYPSTEQKEMRARLQSPNDIQFLSAFFELYMHAALSKLGYKVEIHSTLMNGNLKRPDFLVKSDIEEFYIEVVMSNDFSKEEINEQKIIDSIFDKINEIESEDFYVHIETSGSPLPSIKSSKCKKDVQQWINTLSYDEIESLFSSQKFDYLLKKIFEYEGFKLKIRPIPKYKNRGKSDRLIGSHMKDASWINTAETIRKAIDRKRGFYGELHKPFFLAINVMSITCDVEDVMDALFGTEKALISFDALEAKELKRIRGNDGKWSSEFNTRISGVIIIDNLTPWNVANKNLTIYLNPWAKYPYEGKLLDLPHYTPTQGVMNLVNGVKPHEILGLEKNWPEN